MTIEPHEILRRQRTAKGRSQRDMAVALKMDKSTYHRMERGERRYLVEDAINAAEFLGVSIGSVTVRLTPSLQQAA